MPAPRWPTTARPILLLDPSGMAKRAGISFDESELERALLAPAAEAEAARETTLLLFRTLDGARRAVPVALVERIEDVPAEAIGFSAGKLRVALGERILPLAGCEAAPDDGQAAHPAPHRRRRRDRLRLRRGDRHPRASRSTCSRPPRPGEVARRRPDRRRPGRDCSIPIGCSPLMATPRRSGRRPAGLRAARRRSLDGQHAAPADRKPRLPDRRRARRSRRRHPDPVRRGRGRRRRRPRRSLRIRSRPEAEGAATASTATTAPPCSARSSRGAGKGSANG